MATKAYGDRPRYISLAEAAADEIGALLAHSKRNFMQDKTYTDEHGTHSTMSMSVNDERLNPGKETLIPTVYDGRQVSRDEAVRRAVESGEDWPVFDTPEQATAASKRASAEMGRNRSDWELERARSLPTSGGGPIEFTKDLGRNALNLVKGTPETLATIGSSIAADIPAGYAGITVAGMPEEDRPQGIRMPDGSWKPSLMGDTPMRPADAVERAQEKWTFQPRSESGKRVMGMLGNAMQTITEPLSRGVDYGLQKGDEAGLSPGMMAGPLAALTAGIEIVPGPQKGAGTVARAATRVNLAKPKGSFIRMAEEAASEVDFAAAALQHDVTAGGRALALRDNPDASMVGVAQDVPDAPMWNEAIPETGVEQTLGRRGGDVAANDGGSGGGTGGGGPTSAEYWTSKNKFSYEAFEDLSQAEQKWANNKFGEDDARMMEYARSNENGRLHLSDEKPGWSSELGPGSKQRGSIQDTGAGKQVGKTVAARNVATNSLNVQAGDHATTTPGRIINKTESQGGYTVNMATGEIPSEGLMVGKYANTDKRNRVLEGKITRKDVNEFVNTNQKALQRVENHLGTWKDSNTGKNYMDVSVRYEPNEIRKATKAGERTGQLAGFNIGTFEEFPIGNWDEFIRSPEFKSRMSEMQAVGKEYLAKHPTGEWWDMHGTLFEEVYGRDNLEALAGFIASTAPNTNPTQNLRMASEYMRRHILGEDIVQPDWRVPAGTQTRTEGVQIGMEAGRKNNLNAAAEGRIDDLRSDKVRHEAKALLGDPDAAVFDRWWARISEKPREGIMTATQEGAFESARKTYNQYQELYNVVKEAAEAEGRSVRDFSADVWTGIRETVKETDELFGTKYKGSALTGESKGYADLFDDLIKSKAEFLGITVEKFKDRLSKGDAELLTLLIGAPLGAHAFAQMNAGAAGNESTPGTSRSGVNALGSAGGSL